MKPARMNTHTKKQIELENHKYITTEFKKVHPGQPIMKLASRPIGQQSVGVFLNMNEIQIIMLSNI